MHVETFAVAWIVIDVLTNLKSVSVFYKLSYSNLIFTEEHFKVKLGLTNLRFNRIDLGY